MQIEIVNLHEIHRDDEAQHLTASLHIKIVDYGLHIRGIRLFKRSDYIYFYLPYVKAEKDGKQILFRTVSFDDKERNEALSDWLHEHAGPYALNYLATTPQSTKSLPVHKNYQKPLVVPNALKDDVEIKPNPCPRLLPIPTTQYVDPPPRKNPRFNRYKNL
jgi:hypothetical protein